MGQQLMQGRVFRDIKGWVIVYSGQYHSAIGMARSNDLINWTKIGQLVDNKKYKPFHLMGCLPGY